MLYEVITLDNYTDLYISQATLDGVDISARVNLFYKSVVSALLLIPVIYVLVFWLKQRFSIHKNQLIVPGIISFTGFSFVISDIFKVTSSQSIHLLFGMLVLSILVIFFSKRQRSFRYVESPGFYSFVFLLSGLFYAAILFVFNSNTFLTGHLAYLYFTVFILVFFTTVSVKRVTGYSINKIV